jgi:hypothetical protein
MLSLYILREEWSLLPRFIRFKVEYPDAIDAISPFDLERKRREEEHI